MALKVVARKSGLHGRGLFAVRELAAGEKLIEYTGIRYEKGEMPNMEVDGLTKFLGLSDGTGIDGTGWAALANHGCEPNCELREHAGARKAEGVAVCLARHPTRRGTGVGLSP